MNVESTPQDMTLRSWLALFILALSTFTIVTTELAPVGLLTPIANGLHASESAVGMTVSLYAWVGALSALFASVFLGNVAKKRLLLTLTVILFLSNVLAATVSTYTVLLAARVLGALAHGAFWAMIGATAVSIVPTRYIGAATSIVFGGVSAASVFGVPVSNYIGIHFGWRQAFWLMAILSVVAFAGISVLIPQITSKSAIGFEALKSVLKSSALWKIYSATLLAVTAHFAAFTYIEPWLHTQHSLATSVIPAVLFVYGIAGLAGNFLTGMMIDKYLKATVSISVLLICAVLVFLGTSGSALSGTAVFTAMVIWGVAVSGIFVGFQTWVLRLAEDKTFPASAVYVSFFNTAIGIGASAGAWMVSAFSVPMLYVVAGVAIGLSVLLVAAIPTRVASAQNVLEKSYE
ncbi:MULTISPECIES: MFS transporter [Erwinia]|uniref:MFS transporter n=1 Tax=Erwinia rhapontici TaxID=55212 RepID=A0ABM7N5G5_ERWRD|nr:MULTISPECIES: MFS transporter [Erwinia]MBP2152774.1 putative MFS family arabinose efflux permease [Erwinia rhapontici]MCS3608115.1 putative MFS family arabinose efflux permease [Erwinia rhapontici]NNS08041.1 MFS transporter [Erwinia sp. JH02]TDT00580.1 putative MFS family arabinose efflux permease [Erwinia rhapontici]UDQ79706.1 MFS transporter [Erwinia rhapontici]